MLYVLYTIHVIVCLFLILVVLLQQGKGADLSVFGGGGTQTAFGARGAATLLHKLTVFSFIAFILTTVGIGFLKSGGGASVMSTVAEEAAAEAEAEAEAAEAAAEPAPVPPAAAPESPAAESDAAAGPESPEAGGEGAGGAADGTSG